jgi:hypothetical protein
MARQKYRSEYSSWEKMFSRRYDPRNAGFHNYGGRGVVVCERWHVFANFLADMGEKPDHKLTLDRIDNSGNYEPGNVRWATRAEQGQNRRDTKFTWEQIRTIRADPRTVRAIAADYGVHHSTIWAIKSKNHWKEPPIGP